MADCAAAQVVDAVPGPYDPAQRLISFLGLAGASTLRRPLTYSLYLKRKLLLDVFTLSGLYTVRILAGSAATGVAVSSWLAGFSVFFFLSLAFVKRFSELEGLRERGVHGVERARATLSRTWNSSARSGDGGGLCGGGGANVLHQFRDCQDDAALPRIPCGLWLAVAGVAAVAEPGVDVDESRRNA